MRRRPLLLDLFCGAGGAAAGYHRAGFDVVGVDLAPQPRYPFAFLQADALAYLRLCGAGFDAVHASPPCQRYSALKHLAGEGHQDLVGAVREALLAAGRPYVIENVPGAPLRDPVLLCGTMFQTLRVYRHRLFETSFPLPQPDHPPHVARFPRAGRGAGPDGWISVAGHVGNVAAARAAMGIDWMSRDELAEAVPPPYTEYIGRQLRRCLQRG